MAFSMSQPLPGTGEFRISHAAGPDGARVYLFKVLSAAGPHDIRRFAGVHLTQAYLHKTLLNAISEAAQGRGAGNRPVFAVFENGRQIVSTAGWSGNAESRSSLTARLPLWEIA